MEYATNGQDKLNTIVENKFSKLEELQEKVKEEIVKELRVKE